MKLQYRFLLLLLLVTTAIAVSLFIQHSFELQRSQHILQSDLSQRKTHFKYYLNSEGRTFETFSEDYSFWDDMVTFVKTDDINFAHVNLDSGLSTFGADADWVYRPNGTLLYTSKADPGVKLGALPLQRQFFNKLTTDKFEHFYLNLPNGTLEVRAATIVPGDDSDHKDPASGFWIIGRFLGKDFTDNIGQLSQSTVRFEPASVQSRDVLGNESVTFYQPLEDWQGHTVSYLGSTTQENVISDLDAIYKKELLLLVVVSVLMISLASLAILRLILQPVRTIETSIQRQEPQMLEKLRLSKSQLGELAGVVQQFFQQKLVIQEDQIKKTELEKLNKEKTAFLSLAAHELQSPITVARLLVEELSKAFNNTGDNGKQYSRLEIVSHQIEKMVMLISDIRFASQGNGDLAYKEKVIDFDSFLQKEVTGTQLITKQKIEIEGSTGAQVYVDPDRLSQVISNLIRNAEKYAPDSDRIIIRCYFKDSEIVTEVEDFGVGISSEAQLHIFEKYYRSPEVTQSFQGLGLGLSVCKEIMDHLGGNIWVESSLGHGTHMYISLPTAQHPAPPNNQAGDDGKQTIPG